ncbi:MAG: GNAT family N-acetyltransferase [Deltaproteobacteria bacterium]|nr:GNAT family N-acetyltransferase [Deltaproteobacteria bacterium]
MHPPTPQDFSVINRIQRQAFLTPWTDELVQAVLRHSRFTVRVLALAENGARHISGFYIGHPVGRGYNLDSLAVDTPFRGRGFGKLLLEDWLATARSQGHPLATLQVNSRNHAAQTLYRRYGFKAKRILPRYYNNGDDAYEFELETPFPSGLIHPPLRSFCPTPAVPYAGGANPQPGL